MNILNHIQERRRSFAVGSGRRVVTSSLDEPGVRVGSLVARKLKPYARLEVHRGCVNRLSWHTDGNTLASVSDDLTIAVTNVHELERNSDREGAGYRHKSTSIETPHTGNIFGVTFLAGGRRIATGARDSRVCIADVALRQTINCYRCHSGSVKQVITDTTSDYVFYSGSYDGTIRQYDLRENHQCNGICRNVIISLAQSPERRLRSGCRNKHSWATVINAMDRSEASRWIDLAYRESHWATQSYDGSEVKALAVNPVQSELMAVAASDNLIRVFDRRKLSTGYAYNEGISVNHTMPILEQIYLPRHFWSEHNNYFSTDLAWSPNGERLAVTYESEHVYLFDRHFNRLGRIDTKPRSFTRCMFNMSNEMDHVTWRIRDLETHFARCHDADCGQRNIPKLLYLLLYRDHMGDALLCETMAREAFIVDPQDPTLLFRRIQANIRLNNYYMARKLCLRASRMFPEYAYDFNRIRKMCLLLLNKEFRDTASRPVVTALKSICSARHITSPKSDIDANRTVEVTLNDSDGSDDELNSTISATYRYSITGWRKWPKPETCLQLDEHLKKCEENIYFEDSDSGEETDEDINMMEYQHQMTVDSQNTVSYSVRGSVDYPPPDRKLNMHHYFSYDAPEGGFHMYRHGLTYDNYPIPFLPEHDLYNVIENPSWRPSSRCMRLWGHCNFGTDIAEVNFWGNDVIVSGSADGTVYLYDVKSGRIIDILRGHSENVNCVQVNPQGTLLATSGIDSHIQIWRPYGTLNYITESEIEHSISNVQSYYNEHTQPMPFSIAELRRDNDVQHFDNIGVVKTVEDSYFAQYALAVNQVLKNLVDPLDGDITLVLNVKGTAHLTVGAGTHNIDDLVLIRQLPNDVVVGSTLLDSG
ncbi:WD G-beta repeat containing protein, putative [Babesia ovis]|uniref:WD G-beta repeat containing protein, putative n=1 Tax=Babesia ovis TaxID=5869 RepID=A0A9W5WU98_BABOV|nr:WD G-beta repeat containing protein, putative [Babesia ovis]